MECLCSYCIRCDTMQYVLYSADIGRNRQKFIYLTAQLGKFSVFDRWPGTEERDRSVRSDCRLLCKVRMSEIPKKVAQNAENIHVHSIKTWVNICEVWCLCLWSNRIKVKLLILHQTSEANFELYTPTSWIKNCQAHDITLPAPSFVLCFLPRRIFATLCMLFGGGSSKNPSRVSTTTTTTMTYRFIRLRKELLLKRNSIFPRRLEYERSAVWERPGRLKGWLGAAN